MRIWERFGQPIKRRLRKFRRNSQLKLDGSHPVYEYIDPRYYTNGEGFIPDVAVVALVDMNVQELKDFLSLNNVDFTGVTLKADLLVLAQAV